jgi:hypothetical protein
VRDPAWAAVVNADPELRQYVRNVKMSAEDQKARMRTVAAPIFAAQVRQGPASYNAAWQLHGRALACLPPVPCSYCPLACVSLMLSCVCLCVCICR